MTPTRAAGAASWLAALTVGLIPAGAFGQSTRSAIFSMAVDGADVIKISHNDKWWLGNAAVSRDAKKLAYAAMETRQGWGRERIFVEELGVGNPVDLGFGDAPGWSPDGKEIVFFLGERNPENAKAGVYVMSADGSRRTWLCEGTRPRWSPDGKRIVLVSGHEGFASLYVIDALTLQRTRVLKPGYPHIIGASWSPDSKRLVFVGYKRGSPVGVGHGEVAIVDVGMDKDPVVVVEGAVGWHPDWSPDGKQIVFWYRQNQQERLHLIETAQRAQPRILPGQTTARNSDAIWSPDGKRIIFSSDRRP